MAGPLASGASTCGCGAFATSGVLAGAVITADNCGVFIVEGCCSDGAADEATCVVARRAVVVSRALLLLVTGSCCATAAAVTGGGSPDAAEASEGDAIGVLGGDATGVS